MGTVCGVGGFITVGEKLEERGERKDGNKRCGRKEVELNEVLKEGEHREGGLVAADRSRLKWKK